MLTQNPKLILIVTYVKHYLSCHTKECIWLTRSDVYLRVGTVSHGGRQTLAAERVHTVAQHHARPDGARLQAHAALELLHVRHQRLLF